MSLSPARGAKRANERPGASRYPALCESPLRPCKPQTRGRPAAPGSGGALALVVHLLELGVDHALGVALGATAGTGAAGCGTLRTLLGAVHRLAELHRGLGQRVGLGLDRLGVLAVQHALE